MVRWCLVALLSLAAIPAGGVFLDGKDATYNETPFLKRPWATPVWMRHEETKAIAEVNEQLKDLILNRMKKGEDKLGVSKSNVGGWQSAPDFFERTEPCVVKLRNYIYMQITEYLRAMAPAGADGMYKIAIGSAWANVNQKHDMNAPHTHTNCVFSGSYYVDDGGDDRGWLEFADPRPAPGQGLATPPSWVMGMSNPMRVTPAPGKVLIWPSFLLHYVLPHQGKKPRISIAFNAEVTFPPHEPNPNGKGELQFQMFPVHHTVSINEDTSPLPGNEPLPPSAKKSKKAARIGGKTEL